VTAFRGVTVDVRVSDLERAQVFYEWWHGRPADLRPDPRVLEWILHREPQVAFRVIHSADRVGMASVGVGVADLDRERSRLQESGRPVPEITRIPGVIALLELEDDDGNEVVLWQDLMVTA
jgi:hypothetical protein